MSERNDIAFYIKLFPLKFHRDSYWKSKSMVCTKSTALLEDNFEKKPVPRPGCETEAIDKNITLAESLGITGTPTLVLPDGFVVFGAMKADDLTQLVLQHRRKGQSG